MCAATLVPEFSGWGWNARRWSKMNNWKLSKNRFLSFCTFSRSDCYVGWKVDFVQQPTTLSLAVKLQNTSQSHHYTKLMLWWLFGDLQLIGSIKPSLILAKPSLLRRIIYKSTKCTWNFNAYARFWSTVKNQSSTLTFGCTSHKSP